MGMLEYGDKFISYLLQNEKRCKDDEMALVVKIEREMTLTIG
jgi:hypothetical protein